MNNIINLVYTKTNSISCELCNDIINLFEQEDKRYEGMTLNGVDKNFKDTTDFIIPHGEERWDKITKLMNKELVANVVGYVKKYNNKINETYNLFNVDKLTVDSFQIQKYNKNVGKFEYHHDGACNYHKEKKRVLTFMWYLNDVEDGGETEFWSSYNIKPEAGKLVLFPASWTFPHCGKTPISNDKYIITGWLWVNRSY
tara:strand:+ start:418 stop:1014 length:597 start_codon:yes stop_codon:yes gene_type:complete